MGADQEVVAAVHTGAAATWLVASRRSASHVALIPLAATLACFALIGGIDVFVVHTEAAWRILAEDGAKLFGISAWGTFALVLTRDAVCSVLDTLPGSGPRPAPMAAK